MCALGCDLVADGQLSNIAIYNLPEAQFPCCHAPNDHHIDIFNPAVPDKLLSVGIHITGWQYSLWIWSNANHFNPFFDFVPAVKNACRNNNNVSLRH